MEEKNTQALAALNMESLGELLPCGFAVLHGSPEFDLLSCNAVLLRMLGYESFDALCAATQGHGLSLILPQDRPLIAQAAARRTDSSTRTMTYRALRKDGSVIWVQQRMNVVPGEDGTPLLYGTYFDITEAKASERHLNGILDNIPAGILVFQVCHDHFTIIEANPAVYRMMGFSPEETVGAKREDIMQIVHPEDWPIVDAAAKTLSVPGASTHYEYRSFFRSRRDYVWVAGDGFSVLRDDGEIYAYISFTDITEQKRQSEQIREDEQVLQSAISNNGIDYWTVDIPTKTALFSRALCGKFQILPRAEHYPESVLAGGYVHPQDEAAFAAAVAKMYAGAQANQLECRTLEAPGGRYIWSKISFTALKDGTSPAQKFICTAVSIQERKRLEQYYASAEEQVDAWTWELDIESRTATALGSTKDPGRWPMGTVVKNVPDSLVASGLYSEETAGALADMYQKVIQGGSYAEAVVYRWSEPHHSFRWFRSSIERISDSTGAGKAIVSSRDITAEKLLEQQYESELKNHRIISPNLILNCRFNLSQDKIEQYWSKSGAKLDILSPIPCFSDYLALAVRDVSLTPEECRRFDAPALLETFMHGEHHVAVTFVATDNSTGFRRWIRYHANMMTAGLDGNIMAFSYLEDVTDQMMTDQIVHTMTQANYDMVGYVVVATGRFFFQTRSDTGSNRFQELGFYQDVCRGKLLQHIPESDREAYLRDSDLDYALKQLEENDEYQLKFRFLRDDGEVRAKRARYRFTDASRDFIILTQEDNTALFQEMEHRQQELTQALAAAEVASRAKTDFLSRISHEIRTPMNAIMGMTAIAKDNNTDFSQVNDCLDKIDSSSRYLLTLINDILEMSRIESGRIEISRHSFAFSQLMQSVETIISPLTKKSGLRFDVSVDPDCSRCYFGDEMRIQQVLVNILSNAVKFTHAGGRVRLSVRGLSRSGNAHRLRFTVEDSGIGISPDFLPHLFEAFSQENGGTTSEYGGSGLGMAICKSLVDAMGGTLTVESIVDVGSTFTVELPLEIDPDALPDTPRPRMVSGSIHLDGCRVLMAEDHPLNVAVAKHLMERKGVSVTVANNGQEALDLFRGSAPGGFDLILMDIRMPVMDGLASSRAIRALDRPDAKSVPIIAMTANALDEDRKNTREAGMNSHLSKPIDPELLYQTIQQYYTRRTTGE